MFYDDFEDYNGYFCGGYDGNSMSNRARLAYATGEKPASKWTKKALLDSISEYFESDYPFSFDLFCKLSTAEIKKICLSYSSYHHTSSAYNKTKFYEINFECLENLTDEQITEIIKNRKPREKKAEERPLFVTSEISFKISVRGRRGWHSDWVSCVVNYMSNDKIIKTPYGNKRLNCVYVKKTATQKTKYPNPNKMV